MLQAGGRILRAITKQLRQDKRAVSTVITVMLSLVLLVIIVGNVFLTNYKMNQIDMDKNQEEITLNNIETTQDGTTIGIKNSSPLSVHIVAIWVLDSNAHRRYVADLFLNSGEASNYTMPDVALLENFVVKVVTERGNIAVYSTA